MNKMKKLLSVVLAVVLALSAFSIMGSAAKTNYKTVNELTALDAYSPYGQVTRLSLEERTSIVFDALDNLLAKANINMGTLFSLGSLSVTIDLTSVDRLCYSVDSIKNTFTNTLASIAMGIVNLGIIEYLEPGSWQTGMSRDGTANFTILSEVLELLSANTELVGKVFTEGLDLGIISLGDMSAIEDIIMNLPGMLKGLVYPMIERWDDPVSIIKELDKSIAGESGAYSVEEIANWRVKKLFSDNMSITTIKYDANGNMTSEHTEQWLKTATGSAAPTATDNSPRCYYQFSSTTPGSVMTVYHIVDAAEAEALAKSPDEINGSPAAYTYFKEKQTFVMSQEVEGSETYVWKATDDWGNTWALKWYNDDSQFLDGFSGDDFDLTTMSLAEILYTFIPPVFENMAPVVLNGSVKKILAEFLGAKFTYVGDVGSDEVNALPDASNAFFTKEQGEYLWEWSDYAIINGNHYWRYEDQIWAGDLSNKNNYFDIINWDYKITADFMDEFVPANGGSTEDTLLMNLNNFIIKVANTALKDSAATVDAISGFEAQWTKPALTAGGNDKLVGTIKAIAQAVIGLAPQHVFGSDYATNERCYVELMLDEDNDVVLTGIAAHLVNMLMPSMSLPGKSDLVASGAKVGAILAAVIREFAAYLAPEYNFDALIYTDFGTTSSDKVKSFLTGKDAGYWLDVCLTMGINVGFEYLRAFADMGEGTEEWNAFVSYSGYGVDGKTYAAGTTQEALNAEWEGMLDYVLDWALTTDKEWCWAMANLVDCGATIDLTTAQDPWVKLDKILNDLLPVDEILNVTATDCETELEQLLRYDLILALVELRWGDLADLLKVPDGFVRNTNALDQLAAKLKGIVNYIFKKLGNSNHDFALIPAAITDFDSLANQDNLVEMVKNLVGALHTALVTNGGCRTIFPFLNFFLGWKTDPQKIADPEIWTEFRDGNDYAFQYNVAAGGAIDSETTKIKILNNSSGMLETHRKSSVTDHAYDIIIKSITSDAKDNTVNFNVVSSQTDANGNPYLAPYESAEIKVSGTYNAEEAITVTIGYDYIGKDGNAIGGTQYTTVSFLLSNQYEDANLSTCWAEDHDKDYTGLTDVKGYVFTEDLYKTVTEYEAEIHYMSASLSNPDKSFVSCQPEGYVAPTEAETDCDGNVTKPADPGKPGNVPTGEAAKYFAQYMGQAGGWANKLQKEGTTSTTAKLYYALDGVNENTEFAYGAYDMGEIGVKYGSDTKVIVVDFIYYNDYGVYDVYTDNKDNGYNANQGVAAETYEAYRTAWNKIVYLATYPMLTTSRNAANWEGVTSSGTAETDYVAAIMPQIEQAIKDFEAAKKNYEAALASSAGSSDTNLPAHIQALEAEIEDDFVNGKEINFQDYNFYEYFNYSDVKDAAEKMYRSFLAPEVMDQYYILNSGIREAELNKVIEAETNSIIKAGITASRLENDADAIAESQRIHDEWQMPLTSKLLVEDMTSRLAFYKQFLAPNAEPLSYNNKAAHLYFLEKEIAHVEAQGLVEADYTEASWANYAEALDIAKKVAAGNDPEGFSDYNSRIYDVKWNLMVAYKNLLSKEASLIEAGGIADLLVNIEKAEAIFASLEANDGTWALAEDYEGEPEAAYAQLISALGYYYTGEDGNEWNLYADSAYEYRDNDRPDNQNNQAKVNASNSALEAAIANFALTKTAEPELLLSAYGEEIGAVISTNYGANDGFDGAVFGIDTLGTYEQVALMDCLETPAGYIEINTDASSGVETTGAVIELYDDDDNLVASYIFIYFGDVDMDGMVSSGDGTMIIDWEYNFEFPMEEYLNIAADVDGDTMASSGDGTILVDYEYYFDATMANYATQAEIAAYYK